MKTKHILTTLFFLIFNLQPIAANVILHQDTKVLMDVDVIQNVNDQNYTIEKGATLIMESGATLKNIDTLIIKGTLDAQSDSSILNLKKLINNGEMITTPYIKYIQRSNNLIVTDKNTSSSTDIIQSTANQEENQNTLNASTSTQTDPDKEETRNESTSTQTDPDKDETNSIKNQGTAVLGISQDSNEIKNSAYVEKNVSTMNYSGVILLIFFTSMITLYFVRKEEKILS